MGAQVRVLYTALQIHRLWGIKRSPICCSVCGGNSLVISVAGVNLKRNIYVGGVIILSVVNFKVHSGCKLPNKEYLIANEDLLVSGANCSVANIIQCSRQLIITGIDCRIC